MGVPGGEPGGRMGLARGRGRHSGCRGACRPDDQQAGCAVLTDVEARIEDLASQLAASGCLTDRRWRHVLHTVPRHFFAPRRATAVPGSCDSPPERVIDLDADPAGWWDAVYSDMAIITQRDDGTRDPAGGEGLATCSLSAPGVVVSFLELLDLCPGQRVLEVGTGTGWTAALLAAFTGEQNVTSVEIDPALIATAGANLRCAGQAPRLVHGDGVVGLPDEVFDRVHVTCGVSAIPYAWVEQLALGGVAVLPLGAGRGGGCPARVTPPAGG